MDINTILVIGFAGLFGYLIYKSLKPIVNPFIPLRTGLLVAQDTGKTHYNQSKTGDTSLFIQKVRRKAIRKSNSPVKETHTQLGSATGALETYFVNE